MASDARMPDPADRTAETPPEPRQEAAQDAPPTGLLTADSWAEAADATGTVRARREMPEPDSLGG